MDTNHISKQPQTNPTHSGHNDTQPHDNYIIFPNGDELKGLINLAKYRMISDMVICTILVSYETYNASGDM